MAGGHAARAALLLAIIVCVSAATDYTKYQGVPRASGGNRHRGRPNVWVGNGHEPRRWGQTARCADAACKGRKDHGQYQNVHLYGERWAAASGSAVVSSSFISSTDGWSAVWDSGTGTGWQLSHDAGGAVATETEEVQARTWYFYSPPSFAGDRSAAYNGKLAYTLSHKSFRDHGKGAVKSSCTAHRDCNGPSDIVLEAECGYSLVKKGVFTGTGMSETVEVTLNEDQGWRDTRTGKKASLFDFLGVLSHLKAVWVRGSYYSGTESTRISDVKITAGKKWEPCCTLDDTIDICNTKGNRYFNPSNLKFYCEGSQANQVRVTSVFPRYGRRTGGSTITVEGTNFGQDGTTPIVRVGGRKCKKTYFPTHQPLPAANTIVRENKIDCTSPPDSSVSGGCTSYRVWLDQEASPEPRFYVGMMIKIGNDYRRITRYHAGEKASSASNGAEGTVAGTGSVFDVADKYVEVDQPFSTVHNTDTTVYTIFYVPPFGNAWRARPLRNSQIPTAYDSHSFDGYDSFAHDGNVAENTAGKEAGVNVREAMHSGTAQAGATGATPTIQLDATGSSAIDDYYNGWTITLTSGPGYFAGGVTRTIVDYVGSSKTATVDRDWEAPPGGTPVAPAVTATDATTYAIFRDGAGDNGDLGANAETVTGPKQHTRVVCVTPEFSGDTQPFDNDVTVEAYAGGREGPFRVQALGHGRTGTPSGRFATSATSCVNEESRGFEYGEHDFRWSVHLRASTRNNLGDSDTGATTVMPQDMAIDHNNGDIYIVGNVKQATADKHAQIFVEGLHVHKGYPVKSAVADVDDFTSEKLYMETDKAAGGGQAGYIAKFSKTGEPLWITYGRSDASTPANRKVWFEGVTVDYTGNTGAATAATADVYVSGRYQASAYLHHVDKTSADRTAGKDRPHSTYVQVQAFAGVAAAVGVAGDEAADLRGFLAKYDGAGQVVDTQGIYNIAGDKNLHASSKLLVRSYRASASHVINDHENGGIYLSGQIAADGTAFDWTFGKFKPEYQNGGTFTCNVRVKSGATSDASAPTHYEGDSADCDDDKGLSNSAGWLAKYDKNLKVDWVRSFQLAGTATGPTNSADATIAGADNAYSIVALAVHGDTAYVTGARGADGDMVVTKAVSTRVTDPDKGYGMGQRGAAWEKQPSWKRHEQGVVSAQAVTNKVAIDLAITQPATRKGNPLTQAIGRPGWLIRVKGNPEGHDMDDITAASTNQDNVYTTGPPHPGTGGTNFGDNVRRITAVAYSDAVVTYTVDSAFEKAPTCTVQNHGGASGTDTPAAGKEKVCDLYELWDPQPRAYQKWSMQGGLAADADNQLAVQALAYADPEIAPPALRGNWQHWDSHETLLARLQPRDNSAPHDVRSENSFSDPAAPGAYVYIAGTLKGAGGAKGFCHYDAAAIDQTSACLRAAFPVECQCSTEDETKNGQPVAIKRCNRDGDLGIGAANKPPCNGEVAASKAGTETDLFIAKYRAADGALMWVKRTGEGDKDESISSMAVDWKTGGVYITGNFAGSATMDCGTHAGGSCGTDNFGLVADEREDELGCPMDTRPEESCFDTNSADFDAEYCKLRSRGKPWCQMLPHKASGVTGFLLKVTDGVRMGRTGAVAQRGRVKTSSHGYMSTPTSNCYTASQGAAMTAAMRKCGSDGMVWAKTLGLARCAGTGTCQSKGVTVMTRDTDVYVLGDFTAVDDGGLQWSKMRTPGVDDLGFETYLATAQDGVLYKLED